MISSSYRSGFVSIIGSPNAGKSTLMNRIVGQKVSIVSPKAQTTRNRIMGVATRRIIKSCFLIRRRCRAKKPPWRIYA